MVFTDSRHMLLKPEQKSTSKLMYAGIGWIKCNFV